MKITARRIASNGGARRLVVDRGRLSARRLPAWGPRSTRAVSWFSLFAALCLHAAAVGAVVAWQMPAAVEVSEPFAVTLLPEIPPMAEYVPLPGAEGEKAADSERTECSVAAEAGAQLSNYWDFVRAEIAACVRYPQDAIRWGVEGTVDLRLTVDARGGLVDVVPLREAPALLIRPAVSAAYRAAPFPPNPDRSCRVASAVLPVHFRLNTKQERNSLE